jgi:hypothetical protein
MIMATRRIIHDEPGKTDQAASPIGGPQAIRSAHMNCVRLFIFAGAIVLSGCTDQPPLTGQAQADAATRQACRQRAEAIYNQQNRGEIYSPASQVNTPYSGNYLPDRTDHGLSDLFVHDKLVSDCVRNTGTGADPGQPPPAAQR